MTGAELMVHLAKECDEPMSTVKDIVTAMADAIRAELVAGRASTVPGLGSFRPMLRPGKLERRQVAWQADDLISRTVRETQPSDVPPARIAGERKARPYKKR